MKDEVTEPAIHFYQRPYGCQERLTLNTESTVKLITVEPGHHVGLHRHEKRDELWTVLDGPLDVEIDGRAWTAATGERVWIPRGMTHRIGNTGRAPGRFLEVAFGFFDENDIERLADDHHAPSAAPVCASNPLKWSELDDKAVAVSRVLAADAVQHSGGGHAGTAMALAPAAYLLFQQVLRHDPSDPAWIGRDRFVLSCGHSSLTLYIQLFLSGYGLTMEDIEGLRQWKSRTPAHPEYGHTVGVETTTGPLGQGLATAVGMAVAARGQRGLLDPDTPAGESVFDHTVWVFAGDGDLEEGVTSEASSLAGHQQLGNLVVLYDDNRISMEGDTSVAFSEDVLARYEAYGWHTQRVTDINDLPALDAALRAAREETARPSIIAAHSVIGWPAPNVQGTAKAHGSALGADEVAATKRVLGLPEDQSFHVPDEVLAHARQATKRGRELRTEWGVRFEKWRSENPERAALLDRLLTRSLPDGWTAGLPEFPAGKDVATRTASGEVLNAIAGSLPELWGGSADLGPSNFTHIHGADSFLPEAHGGSPYGRNLHFGVREHAMGSILNGLALYGFRAYGGTFLVFSDYMRPAVRLAALMRLPVTYVWTHDSIGLGEDGPTHQPVEHFASLRAIPRLDVVRPADANETAVAWRTILERTDRPAGLLLSRQKLPVFDRQTFGSAEGVARGGYVLVEACAGSPRVILIGTGSEVQLAVEAAERLEADGIPTRVVSMPCVEWFNEQDEAYRRLVLPPDVRARVSIEAGITTGWREFVGEHGVALGVGDYGASAPYQILYEQFGLTADHVVAAARESLAK
ncbi:transketolase [Streptomyces sp. BK205]|uniref:transketolase n=1 Tax=Streptomyces sp. BK205 TaxID=2512164 RepID=UPI0010EC06C1|nr:transketolase [Streptomyces sp. BK205]TCR16031.1 transketolase [Streptomyces sp. BK205]